MKIRIVFSLIVLIYGCAIKTPSVNPGRERLNIKDFYDTKNITTDSVDIQARWKTVGSQKIFVLKKNDLKAGLIETIGGNETDGFEKRIERRNSDVQEYIEYFGSGEIRMTGSQYIGEPYTLNGFRGEIFNLGVWVEYNKSGEVVKTIDYDKRFAVSLEDVKKIISESKIELIKRPYAINRTSTEIKGILVNRYILLTVSDKPGYDAQQVLIDGDTGAITYGDYMKFSK